MEKTNKPTADNAVPQADSAPKPLERTYKAAAPYWSDHFRQAHASAYQLAKSTRVGFMAPDHLIMGVLASESPIIRAVRDEFMVTPADLWPSLRGRIPEQTFISMCNGAPLTPRCKDIYFAACQTAHDANRRARVADLLVHFFDYANNGYPHDVGPLGILADFDLTQAPVVSFIKSREHLESPIPPAPPEPLAPRPERRVWRFATDRYADWRIRPAARQEDPPASQK